MDGGERGRGEKEVKWETQTQSYTCVELTGWPRATVLLFSGCLQEQASTTVDRHLDKWRRKAGDHVNS